MEERELRSIVAIAVSSALLFLRSGGRQASPSSASQESEGSQQLAQQLVQSETASCRPLDLLPEEILEQENT